MDMKLHTYSQLFFVCKTIYTFMYVIKAGLQIPNFTSAETLHENIYIIRIDKHVHVKYMYTPVHVHITGGSY